MVAPTYAEVFYPLISQLRCQLPPRGTPISDLFAGTDVLGGPQKNKKTDRPEVDPYKHISFYSVGARLARPFTFSPTPKEDATREATQRSGYF